MTKSQIIWLVILILTLIVMIAAGVIYQRIRKKITDFSQAAFGTDNILEGFQKQSNDLVNTPKSVMSMTKLMEPQICRDFPDFSWNEFKHKAENMLISAFQAISAENTGLLKEASEDVKEQVANQIEANQAAGVKEYYDNVRIHQTEIANYSKRDGKCIITIQSAVEYLHYKEKNGKVIQGEQTRKEQTKYNVELMYIQNAEVTKFDNAVGTICPNCGAPITNLGRMVCEYCGSEVVPINVKVWSLHKFYEVDYHHVS